MSTKYKDEGDLFWTFFGYVDKCFVDTGDNPVSKSLDECYDWNTVMIQGREEVGTVNDCVESSFHIRGDHQTDNLILRDDRMWANQNHIKLHPSVTINNSTFTNSTGMDLAFSICNAYREAPDECEISWQIQSFGDQKYDGLNTPHGKDALFEMAQKQENFSEGDAVFGSWHLYAWIVGILAVNFAVMFFLRMRMKRQMRSQMNESVSAAVSQYFALSG